MKILILDSARRDLREGYKFYESQQDGTGDYFLETLSAEIDSLRSQRGIHPIRLGFHRMLSARFPYAVYYRIDEGNVIVRGVLDCRRDPAWIKRRLK